MSIICTSRILSILCKYIVRVLVSSEWLDGFLEGEEPAVLSDAIYIAKRTLTNFRDDVESGEIVIDAKWHKNLLEEMRVNHDGLAAKQDGVRHMVHPSTVIRRVKRTGIAVLWVVGSVHSTCFQWRLQRADIESGDCFGNVSRGK